MARERLDKMAVTHAGIRKKNVDLSIYSFFSTKVLIEHIHCYYVAC